MNLIQEPKKLTMMGNVILPPKLSSWETLITVYFLKRYKLIRTNLLHNNQAIELQNWEEDFDFWKPPKSGFSTDILVEPGQLETLSNQLKVGKSQISSFLPHLQKKMNKITATPLFKLPYSPEQKHVSNLILLVTWGIKK